MRPPICVICGKDFRSNLNGGELVQFALSEEDKTYNQRFSQPGFVGHSRGQEWFCKWHAKQAKRLGHLTFEETKKKFRRWIIF